MNNLWMAQGAEASDIQLDGSGVEACSHTYYILFFNSRVISFRVYYYQVYTNILFNSVSTSLNFKI